MKEKLTELIKQAKYCTAEELAEYLISAGLVLPTRCKDCCHRIEPTKMCAHPRAIGWDALEPYDEDYCSCGEIDFDYNAEDICE